MSVAVLCYITEWQSPRAHETFGILSPSIRHFVSRYNPLSEALGAQTQWPRILLRRPWLPSLAGRCHAAGSPTHPHWRSLSCLGVPYLRSFLLSSASSGAVSRTRTVRSPVAGLASPRLASRFLSLSLSLSLALSLTLFLSFSLPLFLSVSLSLLPARRTRRTGSGSLGCCESEEVECFSQNH